MKLINLPYSAEHLCSTFCKIYIDRVRAEYPTFSLETHQPFANIKLEASFRKDMPPWNFLIASLLNRQVYRSQVHAGGYKTPCLLNVVAQETKWVTSFSESYA